MEYNILILDFLICFSIFPIWFWKKENFGSIYYTFTPRYTVLDATESPMIGKKMNIIIFSSYNFFVLHLSGGIYVDITMISTRKRRANTNKNKKISNIDGIKKICCPIRIQWVHIAFMYSKAIAIDANYTFSSDVIYTLNDLSINKKWIWYVPLIRYT